MKLWQTIVCSAVTACVGLLSSTSSAATINYVSQFREVKAALREDYGIDSETGLPDSRNGSNTDTKTSAAIGLLTTSVEATIGGPGVSKMSHTSNLLDDKIIASGTVEGHTHSLFGLYDSHNKIDVTFTTNAPAAFDYLANLNTDSVILGDQRPAFHIGLTRLDVPETIVDRNDEVKTVADGPFTDNGSIPAGKYRLIMSFAVDSDSGIIGDYAYSFNLSPAAVPLPPTVWMGLMTLTGIAMPSLRRRLHR
jgi:hypothetical protein